MICVLQRVARWKGAPKHTILYTGRDLVQEMRGVEGHYLPGSRVFSGRFRMPHGGELPLDLLQEREPPTVHVHDPPGDIRLQDGSPCSNGWTREEARRRNKQNKLTNENNIAAIPHRGP